MTTTLTPNKTHTPKRRNARKNTSLFDLIKKFENAAYNHDSNTLDSLVKLIDFLEKKTPTSGLTGLSFSVRQSEKQYTRIAAAVSKWLAASADTLQTEDLERIVLRKRHLKSIFSASAFNNPQHLIYCLPDNNGNNPRQSALPGLLAILSLDDIPDRLMDRAFEFPANLLLILVSGWIAEWCVLSNQGEKNRSRIVANAKLLATASPPSRTIANLMCVGWMHCSYAQTPKKHQIKRYFNYLFIKRLNAHGLHIKAPKTLGKNKNPRLLIIHEWLNHGHAMYRCYAPHIRGLAKYFEVISLGKESQINDQAKLLFSDSITYNNNATIQEIINTITRLSPDIIYFPSVGMDPVIIHLANIRLAPLQIASQGHPATTWSPAIDYVFMKSVSPLTHLKYSEALIVGNNRPSYEKPNITTKAAKNEIKNAVAIAVNSKIMKLSSRLMKIAIALKNNAKIEIRFHFFPAEKGIHFDAIDRQITNLIPDAVVHPGYNYSTFMQKLSQCHISMAAFPFGNTNGTVDAAFLGIPTVCMRGMELPEQTDARILNILDLPQWLIANNDQEYYDALWRLIHNQKDYAFVCQLLESKKTSTALFGNNPEDNKDYDLADRVYQLHHGLVQKSTDNTSENQPVQDTP